MRNRTNPQLFKKICEKCGENYLAHSWNQHTCDKCIPECLICGKKFRGTHIIKRKFCSNACRGKWQYENTSYWQDGSDTYKNKVKGLPRFNVRSSKEVTRKLENGRIEVRLWKKSILDRDGYLCQHCLKHNHRLITHHILPYNDYEWLRFEHDNIVTLCPKCHNKAHDSQLEFRNKKEVGTK